MTTFCAYLIDCFMAATRTFSTSYLQSKEMFDPLRNVRDNTDLKITTRMPMMHWRMMTTSMIME